MAEKGYDIQKEEERFVVAYFSKGFNEELSAENQENMTNAEKLANLERLYQHAKSRELPKSLV